MAGTDGRHRYHMIELNRATIFCLSSSSWISSPAAPVLPARPAARNATKQGGRREAAALCEQQVIGEIMEEPERYGGEPRR